MPSASPSPVVDVVSARAAPDGTQVTVEGVLTAPLGSLEEGRGGFLQDVTGGIALLLPAPPAEIIAGGVVIRAAGTVGDRYSQRTLRLDGPPLVLALVGLPPALPVATGDAGEALEGRTVTVTGTLVEAPSVLAGGLSLLVDDGTGPLRVIVSFSGAVAPAKGTQVTATGPLGQRDSTGTGVGGYRVHVTDHESLSIAPAPSPTPTPVPTATPTPTPAPSPPASPAPTPSPTPSPRPTPSPTPTATPTPTPSPSPTPTPIPEPGTIATARSAPAGSRVVVEGVVTAEAGRLDAPPLVAIQDSTGALFVKLPDGAPRPARGTVLRVAGKLAEPYGQLEVRPASADLSTRDVAVLPDPLPVAAATLGESTEARLVVLEGSLDGPVVREASGDLVLRLVDANKHVMEWYELRAGKETKTMEIVYARKK